MPRRPRVEGKGRRPNAAGPAGIKTREQANWCQEGLDTGKVTNQEQRGKLTLKDGLEVDAREAQVLTELLRAKMQVRPEEFRSLLALAQGNPQDASPVSLQPLQDQGLLDSSGIILPMVRSILLSAYTITPEGPVLVSPFHLRNEADKQTAERAEEQNDQILRRWLRDPGEGGPSR